MAQAEHIERLGLESLFRVPGGTASYASKGQSPVDGKKKKGAQEGKTPHAGRTLAASPYSDPGSDREQEQCEHEELEETRAAAYLQSFHSMMGLWMPYVEYSKFNMVMGIICDVQAFTYFVAGKLATYAKDDSRAVLGAAIVMAFAGMAMTIAHESEKAEGQGNAKMLMLLVSAGPCFGGVGVFFDGLLQSILATIAFMCHFLFWAFAAYCFFFDKGHLMHNHPSAKKSNGEKDEQAANNDNMHPAVPHGGETKPRNRADAYLAESDPELCLGLWDDNVEKDFKNRANQKLEHVIKVMKVATINSVILWFVMFSWAVGHYWLVPAINEARATSNTQVGQVAKIEQLNASWPHPAFQPRHLACARGNVFASDGLRVFEVFPTKDGQEKPAREVQCGIHAGRIVDLSVTCADSREKCQPVALVKEDRSAAAAMIVQCGVNRTTLGTDSSKILPRSTKLVELFSEGGSSEKKMMVATSEDIAEYSWDGVAGWVPRWLFWDVPATDQKLGPLRALSSIADNLMLFRSNDDNKVGNLLGTVEVRHSRDMKVKSIWQLPALPLHGLSGACAAENSAALLLVHGQLFKATF
jgi:hypothetical protein